ncbi:hypothetical protein [Rhizobium leguminosarum]|uniref:hypothetical protein n=1 Tax=Rhizobium leguminosarum TaxID=384 RepID=UPI002E10B2AB|nr:hypothetical protein U8Q02_40160 [Rhizobium leguminosarum]
MTTVPVEIEVTPQEAEKFIRAMASAGKVTTTNEIGTKVYTYSFHDGMKAQGRRYEARIDYPSAKATITIHVSQD